MKRPEIYKEIEQMMGLVPSFFKTMPDSALESEWRLFSKVQVEETAIPAKYRELIGSAVAATLRCPYCAYFHAEMAKLYGATDAEIEDAVHFAKSSVGFSTYINGLQIDIKKFKTEIDQACAHIRRMQLQKTTQPHQHN
ncbi:MAG: carboxymuconolactone decarboxylase family protein [Paludibacter sp.]|nr:carboxymuconolactone decarboxylase family protein [Paludibacter sp.]